MKTKKLITAFGKIDEPDRKLSLGKRKLPKFKEKTEDCTCDIDTVCKVHGGPTESEEKKS